MNVRVFRYKVWDLEDDKVPYISPYYAIREFIEQIDNATVIEDDFIEADESDLDSLGRILAE